MISQLKHRAARLAARAFAASQGLFWLPCPRCGEHFGGHERGGGSIFDGRAWRTCCPNCPEHTMTPEGAALHARLVAAQTIENIKQDALRKGGQGAQGFQEPRKP